MPFFLKFYNSLRIDNNKKKKNTTHLFVQFFWPLVLEIRSNLHNYQTRGERNPEKERQAPSNENTTSKGRVSIPIKPRQAF